MLPALALAACLAAVTTVAAQTTLPPGAAAPEGAASQAVPTRDVRLATLFGQNLIDAQRRELGRIDDAVLDLNNDRVTALLVGGEGAPREITVDALRPRDRGLEIVVSPGASRTTPAPPDHVHAKELLGTAVRDADGAPLGRIEDIVVDIDGLGVRYAVVNVAGTSDARLRYRCRCEASRGRASAVSAQACRATSSTPRRPSAPAPGRGSAIRDGRRGCAHGSPTCRYARQPA